MFRVEVKRPLKIMLPRYRQALSAPDAESREHAIKGAEALLAAEELHAESQSLLWRAGVSEPTTDAARAMAVVQLLQIRSVYAFGLASGEARSGKLQKLFLAETICLRIWDNIRAGKKQGVFSKGTGVLAVLADELRANNVRGGRDKDTLRDYWMTYKGVAHFGAGLRVAKIEGLDPSVGIEIGEEIRHALSVESATPSKKPFVPEVEQVFFHL